MLLSTCNSYKYSLSCVFANDTILINSSHLHNELMKRQISFQRLSLGAVSMVDTTCLNQGLKTKPSRSIFFTSQLKGKCAYQMQRTQI